MLLPALLVTSLLGVVVAVGVALTAVGWWALAPYVLVVVIAAVLGVRRARALRHRYLRSTGKTCSCCTSTVFDPVEVV